MIWIYLSSILISCALAQEPTVEAMVSNAKLDKGENLVFRCKTKDVGADDALIMGRFVLDREVDPENDQMKDYQIKQQMSNNMNLMPVFCDTGRFGEACKLTTEQEGEYLYYDLQVRDVQYEDSAHYFCNILNTEIYDSKLFEVYKRPDNVQFQNFSNVDLMADAIHFVEHETKKVECLIDDVVPIPTVTIKVMGKDEDDKDIDYTPMFKERKTEANPGCTPGVDDCLLHFYNDVSMKAVEFHPDFSADGRKLVCSAELPGSELVKPRSASLTIVMEYKPKFRCVPNQKTELHAKDVKLHCKIIANPSLTEAKFEFTHNAQNIVLRNNGDETPDKTIRLTTNKLNNRETEVTLTIEEIFEYHFDYKFKLTAESRAGINSTTLNLVDETFVRGGVSVTSISSIVFIMLAAVIAYLFN